MSKKYFQSYHMSSDYDGSKHEVGMFYNGEAKAEVHDGAIVTLGDLEDHRVYKMKDWDEYKVAAPKAIADDFAVVDAVETSNGDIMGVNRRVGIKTVGLTIAAGIPCNVRRFEHLDKVIFASGNFTEAKAPEIGKFAIPTVGSTLLTVVDNKPADVVKYFEIKDSKPLVEGMIDTDTQYLCILHEVARETI